MSNTYSIPNLLRGVIPTVVVDEAGVPLTDAAADPLRVAVTSLPAGGGLTDAQLRATAVPMSLASAPITPVTGTFWPATQPVSGTVAVSNLPATQPVSGTVSVGNFPGTQPVSGTVAVSNLPATQPVSIASMPSTPVTGPVTDAQLRASAVPVSLATAPTTPVTGTFFQATQPVSAAALPLPSGASTEATLTLIKAKTDNLDVLLSTRTKPSDTQPVSGTFWPGTQPVSGTFFQATQPVSATSLPLPTGASTEATLANVAQGGAPITGQSLEAGESAVLGWLASLRKAITDRLPAALVGGRLDVNLGASGITVPVSGTFWQATQPVSGTFFQATQPVSGSFFQATQPVSLASAPTTPVTGTFWQATQPVSAAALPLPSGAATEATLAKIAPASTLAVTATGAAAAAVTLTLPAVASQFHYLTMVEVVMYCTAARTGGTTPTLVTTTNLPGNPVFTLESAQAVGTKVVELLQPTTPLRSSVVNTVTTIVCPATASVIWRVNVWYYAAT